MCFCNGTHALFVSKERQNTKTDVSGGEHLLKPGMWNNVNKEEKQVGIKSAQSEGLQLHVKAVVNCFPKLT